MKRYPLALLVVVAITLTLSGLAPYDRTTWWLEIFPILIGAPMALADHANRALALARDIRRCGMELTARRSEGDLHLGIGVGVASGTVTVGVLGANSRLEYTAVGPAVNLASRLCAEAAHGEILVHGVSAAGPDAQADEHLQRNRRTLRLKGFTKPEACYFLSDD